VLTIVGIDPGTDTHAIVVVRLNSSPPVVEQYEIPAGCVWRARQFRRALDARQPLRQALIGAQAVVIEFPVFQGPVRNAVPVTREAAALLVRLLDSHPDAACYTPPVHVTMRVATGTPRPDNQRKLAAVRDSLGVLAGGRGSEWNTTPQRKHHVDAALAAIWGVKTIGDHAAREEWRAGVAVTEEELT